MNIWMILVGILLLVINYIMYIGISVFVGWSGQDLTGWNIFHLLLLTLAVFLIVLGTTNVVFASFFTVIILIALTTTRIMNEGFTLK